MLRIFIVLFVFIQIANAQSLDQSIYRYIGNEKAKIISLKGSNYKTINTEDGYALGYMASAKGLTPSVFSFMFTQNTDICTGVSLYFNYAQLNDVISFMDKAYESKSPPPGAKVSFFKAWMEYENGSRYVWKLVKTDKLFFLTVANR